MVISVMTYCQAFTQYLKLVFTLEIIIWKTEPGSLHEIGRWNVMVTILNINFVKSKIYSNTRSVEFFFILSFYISCNNGD